MNLREWLLSSYLWAWQSHEPNPSCHFRSVPTATLKGSGVKQDCPWLGPDRPALYPQSCHSQSSAASLPSPARHRARDWMKDKHLLPVAAARMMQTPWYWCPGCLVLSWTPESHFHFEAWLKSVTFFPSHHPSSTRDSWFNEPLTLQTMKFRSDRY